MKNIKKVLMFLLIILFSVTLSYAAINSDFYKIDRDNKIISRIGPETDIEAFKQKINVSKIYKSKSDRTEITNGLVGTGMAVIDGQDVYELSVAGDFDGDGKATQVELSKIIRHIVGLKGAKLEGLKYESADLTGDGLVDQRDITKYIKYIVFGKLDLGKPNNKPDVEPDTTAPTVTLTTTEPTTSSVTATVNATDDETGIDENAIYTFYIKEGIGEYVQKQNTTSKTCDFTGLKQNTTYTIKVEVEDKAGNKGSAEKTITTGIVPDAETTEGAITFGTVTWADGQASVDISTNTNYYIEYQVNGTSGTWTKVSTPGANTTAIGLNHDDIVYARLTDGTNAGQYATIEIADATAPTVTLTISGQTTSSVTATANATDAETGIDENAIYTFYIKEASASDSSYIQKQSNANNTCTITGLSQNTNYIVKVEVSDVAGNIGRDTKNIQISRIPDAIEGGEDGTGGTITVSPIIWENGKAKVTITTDTIYKIEYQINGTDENNWENVTGDGKIATIENLENNDKVYVRLTDGINAGQYKEILIKDNQEPTVTITTSNQTTSSVTATANATDDETGIDENATYTFYIKEGNGEYVQKQNTTSKTCDFTGLKQNTTYTIKVEVEDKAGNKGIQERTIQTSGIPDAGTTEGAITFGTVKWTDGQASVGISTNTNYYIEYQVNGTSGTWTKAITPGANITAIGLNHDDIVYARLTDGTNAGQYATIEIADATVPTVTLSTTVNTISSVTATANATDAETGIDENAIYTFYIKEGNGEYVQKQNTISKTCDFIGLKQNTTYTIKVEVEDKAGNKGIQERTIQTSGIPDAGTTEGAITFGNVKWGTDSTASVEISTNTNYIIEYQVNGTTEEWSQAEGAGESITAILLHHNDVVYARLTDGTYSGNWAELTVKDAVKPSATIDLNTNKFVQSENLEATITHIDNETGINFTACRWVVNAYATSIGTNTTHYTGGAFTKNNEKISTQLNSVGTFYLHVLSVDNAGNKRETISDAIIVEEPKTLASQVEVGDYVLYDATNNYSYTSLKGAYDSGGNGYSNRTFTSSSDIKWRVLKIEKDQVVLTSDKSITSTSGEKLYLQGATGYLYAEEELNKICSIYGYGKGADTSKVFEYEIGDLTEGIDKKSITDSGARSIKDEDINMEYTTDTTTNSNYGKIYNGNVYYPSRIYKTPRCETRNTKYNGKTKVIDSTQVDNTLFYLMISCEPKGDSTGYFTADRGIDVWNNGSLGDTTTTINSAYYGLTMIYHDKLNNNGKYGRISTSYLFRSEYSNGTRSYNDSLQGGNVRPVVYLKENILTEGKTEDGWIISDKTGEDLNGTITFNNIKWENEKASIEIQNNISTQLKMQYQINSTEGDWTTVEDTNSYTITGLKHNDIVYARLTDGEKFAKYTSLTIIDTIEPEKVNIEVGYETNSSLRISVDASDSQSGISHYTYVVRNEAGNETKYENILDSTYEIENLETNTNYTVYVLAYDKANNEAKSEEIQAKTTLLLTDSYVNKILSLTENTKLTDRYGNRITVPPMFKITNDTMLVTEGIVIEDETGNQFVWVPVGKIYGDETKTEENAKNITLGRYNTYDETINGYDPVQTEENCEEYIYILDMIYEKAVYDENNDGVNINISEFLKFSNKNGGYYIGRYEARTWKKRTLTDKNHDTRTGLTEKPDDYVYNYITKVNAVKECQSMYSNDNFTSDLVNGYAWDTAIIFLQSFGGDATYGSNQSVNDISAGIAEKGTNNETEQDKLCNIYDMNSNAGEYTTEKVTTGAAVERFWQTNGHETNRVMIGANWSIPELSFRPILYFNN